MYLGQMKEDIATLEYSHSLDKHPSCSPLVDMLP
uniref:Uncharacterized protein n=1 Tax=Lotus japonicus TaxID=34305 RepID=I3SMN4_LOTJA|nr:unknown [Lotus japonicus]